MSDAEPETAQAPETPEAPAAPPPPKAPGRLRRFLSFAFRNAWIGLIIGAVLVVTRAVEFSPPPEVRVGSTDVGQLVGDAPPQEFSHELSNPQAVQVRATLLMYPDNEMLVAAPDPEMDEQGKMLSQPVVTTILGMNATVEQTLRLEDGELEVDLALNATPRLAHKPKRGKPAPPIILETELMVHSRRNEWWRTRPTKRVHLDTRAFLDKVEDHGYRTVFTVDGHLFSLDLEIHRALGPQRANG